MTEIKMKMNAHAAIFFEFARDFRPSPHGLSITNLGHVEERGGDGELVDGACTLSLSKNDLQLGILDPCVAV